MEVKYVLEEINPLELKHTDSTPPAPPNTPVNQTASKTPNGPLLITPDQMSKYMGKTPLFFQNPTTKSEEEEVSNLDLDTFSDDETTAIIDQTSTTGGKPF